MSKKTHRGRRGSGRGQRTNDVYNQALAENTIEFTQYMEWITSLAMSRFEYEGLPETCDARYLEECLLYFGQATIAAPEDMPDIYFSIQAAATGELTPYGKPMRWRCIGADGKTNFAASWETGTFIYDRKSRANLWGKLESCAKRLARYSRTENINLMHQFTPYLVTAPEEQVQSVQNVFAQTVSGQAAVVGYEALSDLIKNGIDTIDTQVEWIGDKLQTGALGTWSEVFRILGIPHLQFEKAERMITDEAETTLVPTRLMLEDALAAREEGLDWFNKRFGFNATVSVNPTIQALYDGTALNNSGGDDGDANVQDA